MGEYGWMWISGSTTRWHDEMNQSISKQPDRAGYQKTHDKSKRTYQQQWIKKKNDSISSAVNYSS